MKTENNDIFDAQHYLFNIDVDVILATLIRMMPRTQNYVYNQDCTQVLCLNLSEHSVLKYYDIRKVANNVQTAIGRSGDHCE